MMLPCVRTSIRQFEVLDPVVILHAVDVMHEFVGTKSPPERLLHHVTVLQHAPTVGEMQHHIAERVRVTPGDFGSHHVTT